MRAQWPSPSGFEVTRMCTLHYVKMEVGTCLSVIAKFPRFISAELPMAALINQDILWQKIHGYSTLYMGAQVMLEQYLHPRFLMARYSTCIQNIHG